MFDSERRFELRRIRDIRVRDIDIRLYLCFIRLFMDTNESEKISYALVCTSTLILQEMDWSAQFSERLGQWLQLALRSR